MGVEGHAQEPGPSSMVNAGQWQARPSGGVILSSLCIEKLTWMPVWSPDHGGDRLEVAPASARSRVGQDFL